MGRDNNILSRYEDYFERINEEVEKVLTSRVSLIEDIGNHVLSAKGKRLRPLFFILSCRLCDYEKNGVYRISTIFEYIHNASLLHDDVLDNAEIRRKRPSANHLWGNHAAVLAGDFLYSRSSSIAASTNNMRFIERLTETITEMTEGQILELIHTNDWNIEKETYMEVITAKTAVLMSAVCACAAIISGAGAEAEKSLGGFGLNAGIAFQLFDDLMDYTSTEDAFGKPVGKDLKEGKVTLPLIYTLASIPEPERKRLEGLFKNRQATKQDHRDLIMLVRSMGALDKIRDEAGSYVDRAAGYLDLFPDSPTKKSLMELNEYIIKRES
jgi:octaprenyl-diphosphate synthase